MKFMVLFLTVTTLSAFVYSAPSPFLSEDEAFMNDEDGDYLVTMSKDNEDALGADDEDLIDSYYNDVDDEDAKWRYKTRRLQYRPKLIQRLYRPKIQKYRPRFQKYRSKRLRKYRPRFIRRQYKPRYGFRRILKYRPSRRIFSKARRQYY